MIFCFSGTGNSTYAANKVADDETIISIADSLRRSAYLFGIAPGESLGFVVPVYFLGMPRAVMDFVSRLRLTFDEKPYTYLVMTCGSVIGTADAMFRKALAARGIELDAVFDVAMPGNYTVLYGAPSPAKQEEIFTRADATLATVKAHVAHKDPGDFCTHRGFMPKLMTKIGYSFYGKGRKTAPFQASDKCIQCRKCEKGCPDRAIQIKKGRPKWRNPTCTHCMACLQNCPVEAIDYGRKTQGRARYVNTRIK
ncbi:MAG: EFR1 family ferrodoxin [Kiritimatiellia bacterium]|jgi:ferredoxin